MRNSKQGRRVLLAAALLAAAVSTAGCCIPNPGKASNFSDLINGLASRVYRAEFKETIDKTAPAGGITTISVSEINGTVKFSFTGENVIKIHAVKNIRAKTKKEAEAYAPELKIVVESRGSLLAARTIYPNMSGRRFFGKVDYEIEAPEGLAIIVNTTNGGIEIGHGADAVTAETINGSVTAAGVNAAAEINATNGKVSLSDSAGPATVATTNGSVSLTGVAGAVSATTTNGSITYSNSTPLSGNVSLRCINGSVRAAVSPDSDLSLDASTTNGSVSSALPLTGGRTTKESITGRLGNGRFKLTAQTTNGSVKISSALRSAK